MLCTLILLCRMIDYLLNHFKLSNKWLYARIKLYDSICLQRYRYSSQSLTKDDFDTDILFYLLLLQRKKNPLIIEFIRKK